MKILLPVDGSPFTERMLDYLATHGNLLGAGHDFTALCVVAPVPELASPLIDAETRQDYYRAHTKEILDKVRTFANQQGWSLTTTHAVGSAAASIADAAQRGHFELIVMGSHGHSNLGGLAMGSVTTGVLARCKVPVLIVR